MKWLDNLKQIHKNGIVGNCPFCKSSETDYIFLTRKDGRGCLNIWCNACKESVHFDCSGTPENRKHMTLQEALELDRKTRE